MQDRQASTRCRWGCTAATRPGVDTPITLLVAGKDLPIRRCFEDIDVTQRAVDYYETVFGVTLTAASRSEAIFAASSADGHAVGF